MHTTPQSPAPPSALPPSGPGPALGSVTGQAVAGEVARFGELDIAYDDRVLAPREWTLAQSDWAGELLLTLPEGDVLELCAGVGHIGLHGVLRSRRRLLMVDDNPVACEHALANAERAGMADRVAVRQGRIDTALADAERFALVIADPPWVPTDRVAQFPEDPVHAIDGGSDGLDLVRACVAVARRHLLAGGVLLLQVGPDQVDDVAALAPSEGLHLVEVRRAGERGALVRLDLMEELA